MGSFLSNYASPFGRLDRNQFLGGLALCGAPLALLQTVGIVMISLHAPASVMAGSSILAPLSAPLCFAMMGWIYLCVTANRLRDGGWTGLFALTPLALFAGVCAIISGGKPESFNFIFAIGLIFFLPLIALAFAALLLWLPSSRRSDYANAGATAFEKLYEAAVATTQASTPVQTPLQRQNPSASLKEVLFGAQTRIDRQTYLRLNVLTYFASIAGVVILSIVFQIAAAIVPDLLTTFAKAPWFIVALFAPLFWIGACVSINRLHDIDASGWWLVAPIGVFALACLVATGLDVSRIGEVARRTTFIPIIGFIVLNLRLLLVKGNSGSNRFGAARRVTIFGR